MTINKTKSLPPALPAIGPAKPVTQAKVHGGLDVQVNLPKSSFRLADLPDNADLGFRGLGPAVIDKLRASPLGLTVSKDTTLRLSLAPRVASVPQSKAAPALMGAQAGLLTRVVQAVVALVAAIYHGLLTLLGLRPAVPAALPVPEPLQATGEQLAAPMPLQLSFTSSETLKGTLNGIPAWLAHQEIKSLQYNEFGQGTLQGRVKLFTLLPLPGLTSSFYPTAMRLKLPVLDLGLATMAMQGLAKAYPLGDESFVVSEDDKGRLMLSHKPLMAAKSPWGAEVLRVGLPEVHVEADSRGIEGHGALEADLGDADTLDNKLKMQWQLHIDTKAEGQALSEAALLRLDGAFSSLQHPKGDSELGASSEGHLQAANKRQAGVERASVWASTASFTMHLGTAGHSTLTALRAQDVRRWASSVDDDEISSVSSYQTAWERSEEDFQEPVGQTTAPLTPEAPLAPEPMTPSLDGHSTPSLTSDSSASAPRTPSLLSLDDDALVGDYEAGVQFIELDEKA